MDPRTELFVLLDSATTPWIGCGWTAAEECAYREAVGKATSYRAGPAPAASGAGAPGVGVVRESLSALASVAAADPQLRRELSFAYHDLGAIEGDTASVEPEPG